MNNLLNTIRQQKMASWALALVTGLIFFYTFGMFRHLIWHPASGYLVSLMKDTPASQLFYMVMAINLATVFSASLLAALICSALLIYVLKEKAFHFCLGSIATYFLFSYKIWFTSWKAPIIVAKFVILTIPVFAGLVFAITVWLLLKVKTGKSRKEKPENT